MDPFVIVSYGTSTFRTSACEDATWNEKIFFHVRHTDTNYHLKFTVYDKEKFSGNNLVAWCQIPIQTIIQQQDHTFPLKVTRAKKWKKAPTLVVRSKFLPYEQVRKMFWFHLAKTYDAENTGTLTKVQVQLMLETIGSTISETTIDMFWKENNKSKHEGLTLDELVSSLENYMKAEQRSDSIDNIRHLSIVGEDEDTMNDSEEDDTTMEEEDDDEDGLMFNILKPELFTYSDALPVEQDEIMVEEKTCLPSDYKHPTRRQHTAVEKVIRLKECPICHKTNLARKSQMDILTHVAVCAANDWTTVDRFLMGNFLTEAYATRQ